MKKTALLVINLLFVTTLFAQYAPPMHIPMYLSAGFAEFRANHFHSGLDIKTQRKTGFSVYSIADGYVSRINVSPSGYGNALYIDHPDGRTSVYAHLSRYAPIIEKYLREKQYKKETFRIDIQVPEGVIPVKKNQIVAYSGNRGSSGGPHLHFEIRDTKSEKPMNPLPFYKKYIKDTRAPEFRALMIRPKSASGVVNNSGHSLRIRIPQSKYGRALPFKNRINVWGNIGLELKAIDRMNGTYNTYSIASVKLEMDGKQIFSYGNDSFSFLVGRMYNSVIDYNAWRKRQGFYLKCFIDPGNTFDFYKTNGDGYIQINEERDYHFRYILTDCYGNVSTYRFTLMGKKQDIPDVAKTPNLFVWNKDNHFSNDKFSLDIPKGNLYNNIYFKFSASPYTTYLSEICRVNNFAVPLHSYCDMSIKVDKDTLDNKAQYGIVEIKSGRESWVGGTYENGFVKAGIRELGKEYAVISDDKKPTIVPLASTRWVRNGKIRIKVTDNLSGVDFVRGSIDGNFALFEHDVKSPVYSYKIDGSRIGRNQKHELHFVAKDACGNKSEYSYSFNY